VGTSAVTLYLHDGRATTLKDAILAHDGQAKKARDRFAALPLDKQQALFAFVSSLCSQHVPAARRAGGRALGQFAAVVTRRSCDSTRLARPSLLRRSSESSMRHWP